VPRIVVDVMLKPEILDPQGQAIVGALPTLQISGVRAVRQGKHFELDVDGDDGAALQIAEDLAGRLLANPVIEDYQVRLA
jgi:phosphoribosylformylglycinamidine synthase PurS subunit